MGDGGLVLKQEMTSIASAQPWRREHHHLVGGGFVEVIRGTDLDLYKKKLDYLLILYKQNMNILNVFMKTLQEYGRNKTVMAFWTQRDEIALNSSSVCSTAFFFWVTKLFSKKKSLILLDTPVIHFQGKLILQNQHESYGNINICEVSIAIKSHSGHLIRGRRMQ